MNPCKSKTIDYHKFSLVFGSNAASGQFSSLVVVQLPSARRVQLLGFTIDWKKM